MTATVLNSGLYKITNLSNGKVYVGSSFNLKKRLYEHQRALRAGTHKNQHLQSAYNAAASMFRFDVVLIAAGKQYVLDMERALILAHKSHARDNGYNKSIETQANLLGYKHGPEFKAKLSARRRGVPTRTGSIVSNETRAKVSAKLMGQTLSDETRTKMSEARKGRPQSAEHIAKRTAAAQATKLAKAIAKGKA